MRKMGMLVGLGAAVLGFASGCAGNAGDGESEAVGTSQGALGTGLTMTSNTSFGTGGHEVVAPWFSVQTETPGGIAEAADGSFYVAIRDALYDGTSGFAVRHFASNGTIDGRFDGAPMFTSANTMVTGLAVQPDGKILVAGHWATGPTHGCYALARLLTDGTPDTTFGWYGEVTTCLGTSAAWANALALQPDGRILLAGTILRSSDGNGDDTTFGTNGTAVGPVAGFAANAMLVTGDGHVVTAGHVCIGTFTTSCDTVYVEGFDANGSVDTTFGSGGWNMLAFGPSYSDTQDVYAIVEQPSDGKLVLAGAHARYDYRYGFVARLTATGAVDGTYGALGGWSQVDLDGYGRGDLRSLVVLLDGSIVAAGNAPVQNDTGLVHFNAAGALDTSMGVVHTSVAPQGSSFSPAGMIVHNQTRRDFYISGGLTLAGSTRGTNSANVGLSALSFGGE